jgi:hypothetical protein
MAIAGGMALSYSLRYKLKFTIFGESSPRSLPNKFQELLKIRVFGLAEYP